MYEIFTRRIVLPSLIIWICLFSGLLNFIAGTFSNVEIALAAVPVKKVQENQQSIAQPVNTANTETLIHPCQVSTGFPDSIRQWCGLITQYSQKFDLHPDLIAALIWQESGGNPVAYSHSGAVGLMQVMPRDGIASDFKCPNGPCFANRPTTNELQDPEFNISYGTRMLSQLVSKTGSLREGLKRYGPMDVGYDYADKVLNIYEQNGDQENR